MKFGMAVMVIGCMTLSACTRVGGGGVPIVPIGSVPQPRVAPADQQQAPAPLDYSNTAVPRHSYTPYETRSYVHACSL